MVILLRSFRKPKFQRTKGFAAQNFQLETEMQKYPPTRRGNPRGAAASLAVSCLVVSLDRESIERGAVRSLSVPLRIECRSCGGVSSQCTSWGLQSARVNVTVRAVLPGIVTLLGFAVSLEMVKSAERQCDFTYPRNLRNCHWKLQGQHLPKNFILNQTNWFKRRSRTFPWQEVPKTVKTAPSSSARWD